MKLFPTIQDWAKVNGRRPDRRSKDATERLYGDALMVLQQLKREQKKMEAAGNE